MPHTGDLKTSPDTKFAGKDVAAAPSQSFANLAQTYKTHYVKFVWVQCILGKRVSGWGGIALPNLTEYFL